MWKQDFSKAGAVSNKRASLGYTARSSSIVPGTQCVPDWRPHKHAYRSNTSQSARAHSGNLPWAELTLSLSAVGCKGSHEISDPHSTLAPWFLKAQLYSDTP